jgi:zinc protease
MTRPLTISLGPAAAAPPVRRGSFARALTVAASLIAACGGGGSGPAARPAPPAPATPSGPAQRGELATAEAVLEASIAAQGGRERMSRIKAMRQTGTFLIPQMGMKGSMTSLTAAPRNSLLAIELTGVGKIRLGVSGDIAWEMNPLTGARVLAGPELAQQLREATFNGDLVWKELYPKAELAGTAEFAGKPAYKIVLTAPDGDTQTRFIAKDTLLPLGVQMVAKSQMGDVPAEAELSDWREVGGIKYPHRLQRKEGPQAIEIAIDKIELDPPLDPATFALPPEIAALPKQP